MMPDYVNDFLSNPTSSLVTVKCYPWAREDKVMLIGDAAHAIVPFFGQGMNAGFEDCRKLDELIDVYDSDWKTILDEFQMDRKPDADAIADLAINNYNEMKERTAVPRLLTIRDVARVTSIPCWRLYEIIGRGEGPPVMRVGKTIRISEATLAKWIEQEHKVEPRGRT